MKNQVLLIDGNRTPFIRSLGAFSPIAAHELGRFALNGLLSKISIDPAAIKYVSMGSVLVDPNTTNIAREIVLESSLPISTPAHTVTMACISANAAATTVADRIERGDLDCGIAGGVETFSDLPIRYSKSLRQGLLKLNRAKGFFPKLKILSKIRPKDLRPEIPSPKEFSVGITMGQAGDQLAAAFGISRKEADDYALLSHQRAAEAWRLGYYENQVAPVSFPPNFLQVLQDDGPRPDSTPLSLAKLKPSFNPFGINTAANSSFFSDGASALLLANETFAKNSGLLPLCQIVDYLFAAGDPRDELLLGPALTVPFLLEKNKLQFSDIDVWEVHEAFAGQTLAIVKALSSKKFCTSRLGFENACGDIPLDKMNLWGGSLSLGHPFGATGGRLLLTAAQRLRQENKEFAVVTGCAAGGLGSAILLKRV